MSASGDPLNRKRVRGGASGKGGRSGVGPSDSQRAHLEARQFIADRIRDLEPQTTLDDLARVMVEFAASHGKGAEGEDKRAHVTDGTPCWCGPVIHREPDPWPIIEWLRFNNPAALEICPYKVYYDPDDKYDAGAGVADRVLVDAEQLIAAGVTEESSWFGKLTLEHMLYRLKKARNILRAKA